MKLKENKITLWEAGNDLCACVDYLGEKEEDLRKHGYDLHADTLHKARVSIAKLFDELHKNTHSFGLGPTK